MQNPPVLHTGGFPCFKDMVNRLPMTNPLLLLFTLSVFFWGFS